MTVKRVYPQGFAPPQNRLANREAGEAFSPARAAIKRALQGGLASADPNEAYFPVGEKLGVTVLQAVFD